MESSSKKVVLAHGTFDLLHPGHVAYLEFARSHGGVLVVALSSDEMASKRKGAGRPIQPFSERKAVLNAIRFVDDVVEAPYPTDDLITNLLEYIKIVQPNAFVSSYKEFETKHAALFGEMGIQFVIAPHFGSTTTTKIIEKIVRRYGEE